MIKSFYDESKTYIFLDNFTRIKKFSNDFSNEILKDLNDDDHQKMLVKKLQDADKLMNSDDNTYFNKYAAFIISISWAQMDKLRNYGNKVL